MFSGAEGGADGHGGARGEVGRAEGGVAPDEMHQTQLDNYVHFGAHFNSVNWRQLQPTGVYKSVEMLLKNNEQRLSY